MKLEFHERLSEVDAVEWDRLAGNDMLASHAWLTLVENCTSEPIGFTYVTVRDGDRILGAGSAQRHYDASRAFALDHLFFGRGARAARRLGLGVAPALVVGSRFGISEPLLIQADLPPAERRVIATMLIEGIIHEAERAGASVIVRNATDDSPARAFARSRFQSSPEVPTTYLDIQWSSFAAFRLDLKKIHFSTEAAIRQQNNRARRMGVVLERITDPARVTDEMHALLDSHFRKLNGVPVPVSVSFLRHALRELGDRAVLTIAHDSNQLLGVNFGLRHAGRARSMMVGVDPERGRDAAVYFVLMNNAIERAIEWGDSRLYLGKMLYKVKLLRGCTLGHSTLWIRGRSPVQRGILRSFVRLRTRTVERMIKTFTDMSTSNAAGLGGAQ